LFSPTRATYPAHLILRYLITRKYLDDTINNINKVAFLDPNPNL
jgi:hypothetical protein